MNSLATKNDISLENFNGQNLRNKDILPDGYMSAEKLGVQNHLCVLPFGDESRRGISDWAVEDLRPYQSYLVNGEAVDTMFRGLIFNPMTGRENRYIYPMYADFGELSQKKDWKLALKRLFYSDYNLDAAAQNTEVGKETDIWITLPYPSLTQTNFDKDKKENKKKKEKKKDKDKKKKDKTKGLDFKIEVNRVDAVNWWIESFLKKWNKESHLHKKLIFKGFVWPRASIDERDEGFVKKVTTYIRDKGFLSLWLQQYGSTGCIDWHEFGFDAACTHPNFYGTGPDFSWIANSTVFAKYYHLGMQITFGKGILFKDGHLRDYLNYGVYNDYMNDSLLVYQFPNQTMRDILEQQPTEYNHLYSFINKTYTPVYPTAAFLTGG